MLSDKDFFLAQYFSTFSYMASSKYLGIDIDSYADDSTPYCNRDNPDIEKPA